MNKLSGIAVLTLMSLMFVQVVTTQSNVEDSNQILFNRILSDEGDTGIFVLNSANGEETRLTPPNTVFVASSWSSNGNQILANQIDSSGISRSLVVMDADGNNHQILTNPTQIIPKVEQWFPNNERITFWGRTLQESSEDRSWAIFDVSANGGGIRQLSDLYTRSGGLAISPDGSQILFTQNGQLFSMPSEGGEATVISIPLQFASQLEWSPHGLQLAVLAYSDYERTTAELELHLITPDERDTRLLIKDIGSIANVKWSPDGTELLFRADMKTHQSIVFGFVDIETGEVNTYQVGQGILSSLNQLYRADWSPDGRQIIFMARNHEDHSHNLYLANREMTQIQRLTHTEYFENVVQWRPR